MNRVLSSSPSSGVVRLNAIARFNTNLGFVGFHEPTHTKRQPSFDSIDNNVHWHTLERGRSPRVIPTVTGRAGWAGFKIRYKVGGRLSKNNLKLEVFSGRQNAIFSSSQNCVGQLV